MSCSAIVDELFSELSVPQRAEQHPPLPHNDHLHLPPNFSAFDTVEQAVELGAEQGLALLCASNYYDYRIYRRFGRRCAQRGIFPVFGLEIIVFDEELAGQGIRVNDPNNPGRMYVCGLSVVRFDPLPPRAGQTLGEIRTRDEQRMRKMIDLLNEQMARAEAGVSLSYEEIVEGLVRRHGVAPEAVCLQERHLAQAYQEALCAGGMERGAALAERVIGAKLSDPGDPVAMQNDLRSHLMKAGRPAYVEEKFVTFARARETILEMGGIPCYPILGDGASPICEFESSPEALRDELCARGFFMAQFIPRRNSLELVERYARVLREAGIVLTVGTEHNTLELIPLRPACRGGQPLSAELEQLFWEGACVCAAHQVLVARGERGFVDGEGNLCADPRELAVVGAELIAQMRQRQAC